MLVKKLAKLRPAFCSDIVDDSDIIVTTFNLGDNNKTHIMNVYNNAQSRALKWLSNNVQAVPTLSYMEGNFNIHSSIWDLDVLSVNSNTANFIEVALELGIKVSVLEERSPTHFLHQLSLRTSVIDLMLLPTDREIGSKHIVRHEWLGESDYAPLTAIIKVASTQIPTKCLALPRDS